MYVHCHVCKVKEAGGKDQWLGVRMRSRRAPSSITAVSLLSSAHANACVLETGKIESAEELPYHQFTVPPFPVCVCACTRVCVCPAVYEILLYIPSFPHHNKFIILNKVIFKVTSWLEFLLKLCLSFDFMRKIQFGLQINTCMYSLLLSSEGVQALSSLLRRACRGNQRLS